MTTTLATQPQQGPKNLVSKLCEIMAAIERIPKNGWNDFHKYQYVREADVSDAIRKELARNNVFLSASVVSAEHFVYTTAKAEPWILTQVTIRYTFRDGDSAEKIEFDMAGQGSDKTDKGIYKAITGCTKYALMKTFQIPTGDDPEDESDGGKPLMTADSHGNMKPVPAKVVPAKLQPIKPADPRPSAPAFNGTKEQVFIERLEKKLAKNGSEYIVIHSTNGQRYTVWDTTFFPCAYANEGRTLTLGVKVDAKGYKSIASGLEPIEVDPLTEQLQSSLENDDVQF